MFPARSRIVICILACILVSVILTCVFYLQQGTTNEFRIKVSTHGLTDQTTKTIYSDSAHPLNVSAHTVDVTSSTFPTRGDDTKRLSCKVNGISNGMVLDERRHIIIIGAMSFLGARLAMHFHEQGYHVLAVEDLFSVDNDDMKWYRWTELMRNRIPVQVTMLSRSDKLQSLLHHHSPQAIIYVPTRADGIEYYDKTVVTSTLRNFISLLKPRKETFKMVLISHSNSAVGRGWLASYEAILSITLSRSAVVRVSNVHGPWQDSTAAISSPLWYVNDVGAVVEKALATGQFLWDMDQCTHFFDDASSFSLKLSDPSSKSFTEKWQEEYRRYISGRRRNVTLGAYLVNVSPVSQYGIFPSSSNSRYFFNWLTSAVKYGTTDIVLFHDTLDSDFQLRLKAVHIGTETIHIKPVSSMIANDQRYYFIYDYLLKHPEINIAITTDVRDVRFYNNPMMVMSVLGDHFYAGLDIPFDTEIETHGQANCYIGCFPHYPREEIFHLYGVFNNGVLGGKRSTLLTLLTHLLLHVEVSVHYGNTYCDMSAVQFILHTSFFQKTFIGYPFNSAFFTQTPGPMGLAVQHKPETQ